MDSDGRRCTLDVGHTFAHLPEGDATPSRTNWPMALLTVALLIVGMAVLYTITRA